jgi:perosamine synthetase
LKLIEDACLALGATLGGRKAGSFGDVGVFSFGCMKPIQAGEGGMIVTTDDSLARELRSMRHWGDRTIEHGVRDTIRPAWNGRMSEIIAAVVLEQLKGYPRHLTQLRNTVEEFRTFLQRVDGLELVLGQGAAPADCAFAQVVLRLDERRFGRSKHEIVTALKTNGIPVWHANFEPINSLTLFREPLWREWLPLADFARLDANYRASFPEARRLYDSSGLSLGKTNFLSRGNFKYLMKQLDALAARQR